MRRKVLVALAVLVGGGLIVVATTLIVLATSAVRVKRVRAHPDRSSVLALVGPRAAFRSINLYFLLRPGSRVYNAALLPWIYSEEAAITDSEWNRRLFEGHLLGMPADIAAEHVASYPLTPGPRLFPLLGQALSDGRYGSLRVLDRTAEGRQFWQSWLARSDTLPIPAPADEDGYYGEVPESVILALVQLDSSDLPSLLHRLMPALAKRSEQAPVDAGELRETLQTQSAAAPRLLAWTTEALARREVSPRFAWPILEALLTTPSTSEGAGRYLLDHSGLGDEELLNLVSPGCLEIEEPGEECQIAGDLPRELLMRLLRVAEPKPAAYLGLFHGLLHVKDPRTSDFAMQALLAPDSELRKGIVVLLSRHGEPGVRYRVDDAFRGSAPRTVLFQEAWQYADSDAARAYQRLSGHEYGRIGKRFPPYLGGRIPEPADVEGWQEFIATYPWFPATDDAYYRLAHAHFLGGRFDLAKAVIAEFRERAFVDRDVESYVDALSVVVEAAIEQPPSEQAPRLARAAQEVDWMGWYGDEGGVLHLENSVLAVDWLLANEGSALDLDLDRGFLERLRLALDTARQGCRESWFERCAVPDGVAQLRRRAEEAAAAAPFDPGFTPVLIQTLLAEKR